MVPTVPESTVKLPLAVEAPSEPDGSLVDSLDRRTAPAELWQPHVHARDSVRCVAGAHGCVVASGARGACGVRLNRNGVLHAPFGYVARRYVRAIETNTVYHVLPGARALTFGMYGCDLRCPYCHNHRLSQALRDGSSDERPTEIEAEALVEEAASAGCSVICAAYNEPMIAAEWTRAVFEQAKHRGLATVIVSDGNSTPEALAYLRHVTDVFRVDLKGADEETYRKLGGRLAPVLRSIGVARELGYWVEVVTLVVPTLNHELSGLRSIARALRALDSAIPWHLNAFVPRYRLKALPPADPNLLLSAVGMAYAQGLEFVYAGNVNALSELSHTRCPGCHHVVIRRQNYTTLSNVLDHGHCPECRRVIAGLW